MAICKIKNISGNDVIVPNLGRRLVLDGAVVEVSSEDVYGYTCQVTNWKPQDKNAEAAHKSGAKEEAIRVALERGDAVPEEG